MAGVFLDITMLNYECLQDQLKGCLWHVASVDA